MFGKRAVSTRNMLSFRGTAPLFNQEKTTLSIFPVHNSDITYSSDKDCSHQIVPKCALTAFLIKAGKSGLPYFWKYCLNLGSSS